jgi:ATP/maltotriose-dependent transcriptional regulator MalT
MKLYGESARGFDECIARRNLASVYLRRGKLKKARELLTAVVQQAEKSGYDKQLALALGDLGIVAWRSGDERMTETYCRRSNEIARSREYLTLVFRNCYYLWKVALKAENDAAARINLRTLRSYSGRVESSLPELSEFNAYLAGGESC